MKCLHELISVSLIEEVANIIEEVVLIDKGKVLLQESVENLLEMGYSISGIAKDVDAYCSDKNVIGYDELGNMKIAYVLGEKTSLPKGSSLQISTMNLIAKTHRNANNMSVRLLLNIFGYFMEYNLLLLLLLL